jgi:hypothetical protein
MSTNEWDNDDLSGSDLCNMYEKALKKLKAVESERDTLIHDKAQASASETLVAKGYKPAVARLAIKDGVDLSDEKALDTWLTDNGDLFAKPEATQPVADGDQPPAPVQDAAPPEGLESTFQSISRIHSAASTAHVNAFERALASIPEDATPAQVRAAFAGL